MNLSLATVVGIAGALLAFVCTLPQAAKLMRMRSAAGVSVAALANATISALAWTTFGTLERDAWVALPAILTLPGAVAALVLAWRRGGSRDRLWMPVTWATILFAAAAASAWVGTGVLTVVLGCSIGWMVTPAAITAWRSHDVSALTRSSWMLLIAEALLAGAYGALAGIEANLVYAVVATTGSVAILVRLALPGHVHARLVPRLPAIPDLPGLPGPLARDAFELAS